MENTISRTNRIDKFFFLDWYNHFYVDLNFDFLMATTVFTTRKVLKNSPVNNRDIAEDINISLGSTQDFFD